MSAMRHYSCWIILFLLIFVLTVDADSEDSDCILEIRVRRNTVYNASPGEELKINCPVILCNDSPPPIIWEKLGERDVPVNVSSNRDIKTTKVPVNVSSDSHIKTEWKRGNGSEGISCLIFRKVLQSDAGQYTCRSGGSVSHLIRVNVHDNSKFTTAACTTVATESVIPDDTSVLLWPFVYRVVGILVFVTIVILICITSKRGCKGKPRETTKSSEELPHHVYENDGIILTPAR